MPRIPSQSPDFEKVDPLGPDTGYVHGVDQVIQDSQGYSARKTGIPFAFQVTHPLDSNRILLPHALVMHINPSDLEESFSKSIEVINTEGGRVEQHWPENLETISVNASTGSFMNIRTGLSSAGSRLDTIAHDRFLDILDLYHNNGAIYDPKGQIALQGHIMLMYDRGVYLGGFKTFKYTERDTSPYQFTFSFTFRVTRSLMTVAGSQSIQRASPSFQRSNRPTPTRSV